MTPLLPRLCLTSILAAIALSPAQAAEPYLGRWAEDPAWCANSASNTDDVPIAITARAIEFYATYCRVLSVTRQGGARRSSWRIRTSCRGEGESEKEPRTRMTFLLRVSGNRLEMRDGTGVQTFTRCPPS
jgi:hypothetical protein